MTTVRCRSFDGFSDSADRPKAAPTMASFRNLLLDDGNAVSHPNASLAALDDTTRLFSLQPPNPKKRAAPARALLLQPSSSNLSKLPGA